MSEITTQMLQFLAVNEDALSRFFVTTGLSPNQLRAEAQSDYLAQALLEFFMQDESLLLSFCTHHHIEVHHMQRLYTRYTQFDTSI